MVAIQFNKQQLTNLLASFSFEPQGAFTVERVVLVHTLAIVSTWILCAMIYEYSEKFKSVEALKIYKYKNFQVWGQVIWPSS